MQHDVLSRSARPTKGYMPGTISQLFQTRSLRLVLGAHLFCSFGHGCHIGRQASLDHACDNSRGDGHLGLQADLILEQGAGLGCGVRLHNPRPTVLLQQV